MKKETYVVVSRYRNGGVWHEQGEELSLCRAAADSLVASGKLQKKKKAGQSGSKEQEA